MKIVLGIDDSPCSRTALEFVQSQPWSRTAAIRLLSVVQPPAMVYDVPGMVLPQAVAAVEEERSARWQWLNGIDKDLRGAGYTTQPVVEESDPRTGLVQMSRDLGADLLVVGSHGRTGLSRLLLGSVAGYVVVHASCSVLVVKRASRASGTRPLRILLGIDDSPGAMDATRFLCSLRWPPQTRVQLLSAVPPTSERLFETGTIAMQVASDRMRVQEEILCRHEQLVKDAGLASEVAMPEGDARVELENAANRFEPDLLVVGSHGRTGLSRLVLGSVAAHLVAHAPCSVLVVKRPNFATNGKAESGR